MLFKTQILQKVKTGQFRLAFRKWKRPTVKEGGTLKTPVGLLRIDEVGIITESDISENEILIAGYTNKKELLTELENTSGQHIYRIRFHLEGPDPRILLRNSDSLTTEELQRIKSRLDRYNSSNRYPNWANRVLDEINDNPGKSAGLISQALNIEKTWLKPSIRKLKEMGLTISLEVGYKISPRGEAYLKSRE